MCINVTLFYLFFLCIYIEYLCHKALSVFRMYSVESQGSIKNIYRLRNISLLLILNSAHLKFREY